MRASAPVRSDSSPSDAFFATSLDELPELFNVLKGEMSLLESWPLLMSTSNGTTPSSSDVTT
jgi:lipopolysaccharide/colanic/teichoic acid biosynthesis glycosyltransferase